MSSLKSFDAVIAMRPVSRARVAGSEHPAYLAATLQRAAGSRYARQISLRPKAPLSDWPILSREVLQSDSDALLTGDVPVRLRKRVTTGGSTGAPVGFWLDRIISASEWRYMTAQWVRVGYRRGDWRVVLRGKRLPGGARYSVSRLRREIRISTFDLSSTNCADLLPRLDLTGRWLHAYPSSAQHLAELLQSLGVSPPRPKGILLGSEAVTPAQEEQLQDFFGAPVFSWYGQSEKVLLGGECPASRQYHLYPTYGVAEIVDGEGKPVTEPGVFGRLLGTGLLNTCAPLVRYDTGDQACWAVDPCPCGIPGQRLERVIGRAQDAIDLPGGGRVSLAALNLHSDVYVGLTRLQYVQRTREDVIVRVVAPTWGDAACARLREEVAVRLPGVRVEVEQVEAISPAANGKVPLIVKAAAR